MQTTGKRRPHYIATFAMLRCKKNINLYAGDVPKNGLYSQFVGLSLSKSDPQHIRHDIRQPLDLQDSSVDLYCSEDVFEHIEYNEIPPILAEIYRVLKPGGVLRCSMPDYRCDVLERRTLKNQDGDFVFDPGGGGDYVDGKVVAGGHVWFPIYETVKALFAQSPFEHYRFLHYYDEFAQAVTHKINYDIAHVKRTPDHDPRVQSPFRPMSIVVDAIK